ncbi:MAG TPA: hypothetical protein VFO54_06155, partial [Chryseosolibacter sp.]|nr:hypothetical protein [Chryseosolibacter sp.]
MDVIIFIIQIVAATFGSLSALASILLFIALRWPAPAWWFLKVYTSASSALLALTGVLVTIIGLSTGSTFISLIGIYNVLIFSAYVSRVTQPPDVSTGFEHAFGPDWEEKIRPEQSVHFLHKRTSMMLPSVPDPRMEQNISFATIP